MPVFYIFIHALFSRLFADYVRLFIRTYISLLLRTTFHNTPPLNDLYDLLQDFIRRVNLCFPRLSFSSFDGGSYRYSFFELIR